MRFHEYHLVDASPWPLLASASALMLTAGGVVYMKRIQYGLLILYMGFIGFLLCCYLWFRDVAREGTYQGLHARKVKRGLQIGMILFILSEVMFFISFFWAYFHSSLTPSVDIGAIWPPKGIVTLDTWGVPFVNTVILLSSGVCQKWNELYTLDYNMLLSLPLLPFSSSYVLSTKRIGPHNMDVLSILVGSMLGDGSMERDGNGSRFCFYQEKSHGEYLLWLHSTLFELGYCKSTLPVISSRLDAKGGIRYFYRFRTFTYSSFNWIYDSFYNVRQGYRRKIIPQYIEEYLTPLALAVWIMDDGCKFHNKGMKFSTNCFTLLEVQNLANILNKKYKLNTSIHKTGVINQYNIYICKESVLELATKVKPFIHGTMLYKIS